MTRNHARRYFYRVAVIDAKRERKRTEYRAKWLGPFVEDAPYARLCRAAAMYRVAGYMERSA